MYFDNSFLSFILKREVYQENTLFLLASVIHEGEIEEWNKSL